MILQAKMLFSLLFFLLLTMILQAKMLFSLLFFSTFDYDTTSKNVIFFAFFFLLLTMILQAKMLFSLLFFLLLTTFTKGPCVIKCMIKFCTPKFCNTMS